MHSLSLVIPVYNEEKNIPILLSAIKEKIPLVCDDFEVIFIEDCSTDSTLQMLEDIASSDNRVKVLRNQRNRKLGGCLKEGYKAANKEMILYFDADLPFDLREVGKAIFVMERENADFISAYRSNRQGEGVKRLVYSFVYNRLVNWLFGMQVRDVNFSFKLFKRTVLENITLHSEGSFINAEIFIKVRRAGYKVTQFPTFYYPRVNGCSTLSKLPVVLKIVKELFSFYGSLKKQERQEQKVTCWSLWSQDKATPWFVKAYIYFRLKTCPLEKVAEYIPQKGRILDLGCGFGLFDMLLFLESREREILALDWQEERIRFAQRISQAHRFNIVFAKKDINCVTFGVHDTIVMIDALYLFPYETQKNLLVKCFHALNPGGSLVIKEMDVVPAFKYLWCLIQEAVVTMVFNSNRSRGIHIAQRRKLADLLTQVGFTVETARLDKGYFYPHVVYICRKKS